MSQAPLIGFVTGQYSSDASLEENKLRAKRAFFELVGYEPVAPPTHAFHDSTARHLISRAPARTSKSYSAAVEAAHDFFPTLDIKTRKPANDEENVWLVGVNYSSATLKEWDYVWSWLSAGDFALIRALGGTVTQRYNSPNSGNLRITAEWGESVSGKTARTTIEGKSSTNEVSLQGEEIKTAVLSEAAEHERRVVEKYLETRCGRIIYPTTPKRKALWLYDLAQRGADLGVEEIHFTRECNPKYDYTRYEAAKAMAIATYGDFHDSPEFMEQFEGEWVFHEGKVLPFRWIDSDRLRSHIVNEQDDRWPEISQWLRYAETIVSMDYGYTDAAVALFFAVSDEGQMLLVDEVHDRFLSNGEFVKRIRDKEAELSVRPVLYVPDPQKPEVTKLLRQSGLPVFGGMNAHEHRDRASSARSLVDLLSTDPSVGRPKLLVHSRCQATIREWKALRRKEASLTEAADEWAKSQLVGEQHHFDAARYFAKACRNYKATNSIEAREYREMKAWNRRQQYRLARIAAERRHYAVSQERA